MCNAATNLKISLTTIMCGLMISCSSSDKEKATALYTEAENLMNSGDYEQAQTLLDSIDKAYPGEVDVRRQGIHLRPQLIEKLTLRQLSATDSLLAACQLQSDSLGKYIIKVCDGTACHVRKSQPIYTAICLLYTSDAADE